MSFDMQQIFRSIPRPSTEAVLNPLHRYIYVVNWRDSFQVLLNESDALLSDNCFRALTARIRVMDAHQDTILPSGPLLRQHYSLLERARSIKPLTLEGILQAVTNIDLGYGAHINTQTDVGFDFHSDKRTWAALEQQMAIEQARDPIIMKGIRHQLQPLQANQVLLLSDASLNFWRCLCAEYRAVDDQVAAGQLERFLRLLEDSRVRGTAVAFEVYKTGYVRDLETCITATQPLVEAESDQELRRAFEASKDVLVTEVGFFAMYEIVERASRAGIPEVANQAESCLRLLLDTYTDGFMTAWQRYKRS